MLSLSHSTGYAILALSCLDDPGGKLALVRDVARCAKIPKPYLSKVLNALGRSGLIRAKRGYLGGVILARPAEEISVLEVAEAVEGKKRLWGCLLGMPECRRNVVCPTHAFWTRECKKIEAELRRITLAEMASAAMRTKLRGRCGKRYRQSRRADRIAGSKG
jgi:Rrf2 family transcriptional regulator, iron-sulfur cluster assembly transcription factor